METIWLADNKGSFTVEAVFVMSITLWVLIGICYLSLYSHDKTALYALTEHYLEISTERGAEYNEAEVQGDLKKYLQNHLMVVQVDQIKIKKEILSVRADICFHADIHIPLVKEVLAGNRRIQVAHGVLFPPHYLWNGDQIKDLTK